LRTGYLQVIFALIFLTRQTVEPSLAIQYNVSTTEQQSRHNVSTAL